MQGVDVRDRFACECGVFGVYGHPDAAHLTYLGLHGLQHRGQESAGIASAGPDRLRLHRRMGLVADAFDAAALGRLRGTSAIGHVRYSTAGDSELRNAQPLVAEHGDWQVAIAHNGNLTNARALRRELEVAGSIFHTSSDSEIFLHLLVRARGSTLLERVVECMRRVEGAYSLLLLDREHLVAVRDPFGFRPLVLGRKNRALVFASESCALQLIEASSVREVEPGEVVVAGPEGLVTHRPFGGTQHPVRRCIFEHVYFSRPDSVVFGESVYEVRKALGRRLAVECPAPDADVVVPVPDSGVGAALGYAEGAGLPYEMGLIRSHYVGRTFIEPEQRIRHFGVRLKLSVNEAVVRGRSVVVVDDSLVRGTTSRKIVRMLRAHGARAVHVRIACAPTRWPCFYGIDTPTRRELIASSHSVDEIARFLTADSLGYVSVDGLHSAFRAGAERGSFCDACFTGDYPTQVPLGDAQRRIDGATASAGEE